MFGGLNVFGHVRVWSHLAKNECKRESDSTLKRGFVSIFKEDCFYLVHTVNEKKIIFFEIILLLRSLSFGVNT